MEGAFCSLTAKNRRISLVRSNSLWHLCLFLGSFWLIQCPRSILLPNTQNEMKMSGPLQTEFPLFPDLFYCAHADCPARDSERTTIPVV